MAFQGSKTFGMGYLKNQELEMYQTKNEREIFIYRMYMQTSNNTPKWEGYTKLAYECYMMFSKPNEIYNF